MPGYDFSAVRTSATSVAEVEPFTCTRGFEMVTSSTPPWPVNRTEPANAARPTPSLVLNVPLPPFQVHGPEPATPVAVIEPCAMLPLT